jgi:YaiO family outer membrane protein
MTWFYSKRGTLSPTIGLLLGISTLGAQTGTSGRLDVVAQAQHVTGGLGDWRGFASRVLVRPTVRDTWYGEALWQRAFSDDGVYASVGERHTLGAHWTTYLALGSGTGEFVLPDLRADAQLSHAWGPSERVVTTVGGTVINAKRGYSDRAGMASVTAYVTSIAVVEIGERLTTSSPGGIQSARTFGAMTLGREGAVYVVIRGSSGGEGYQLIGPATAIRKFTSREVAASWRQWFGPHGGLLVQGEHYSNDLYTRSGVSVGVFIDW